MKTRPLLLTLLFPSAAVLAADPPKLVPRPIPGLAALTPVEEAFKPAAVVVSPQPAPVLITNPDQARVLYIHRRATLPDALTQGLQGEQAAPTTAATMLQVRQGAVKIIPKAQVAQIIVPKP